MLSRREEGSVTVLFTLVILILLSVVGTILEAARLQSASMVVGGAAQSALEAVYTGYARELFEDYGIFLLHEKYLPEGSVEAEMRKYLAEDLQESFLFRISAEDMTVEEERNVLQGGIENVKRQMAESVRYEEVKNLYDCIAGSTEVLADSSKKAKEVSDGLAVEDEQELREEVLELMEAVDGVAVKENDYTVKTPFVKQFVPARRGETGLSIASAEVSEKVEGKCCFAGDDMEAVAEKVDSVEQLLTAQGAAKKIKKEKQAIRKKMLAGKDAVQDALEGVHTAQEILGKISSSDKKRLKLQGMERQIKTLEPILSAWNTAVEDCEKIVDSDAEYERFLVSYLSAREGLKKWNIQALSFDYSGIGGEEDNPLERLKEMLSGSMLSLVVGDTKEISKRKIVPADTVSAGKKKESSWQKKDYGDSLKKSELDDADDGVQKQLDAYSEKSEKNRAGLAQELLEKVMIAQYMRLHFGSYVSAASEKETALQYEAEYILCGKSGDADNLAAVVGMISALRTPLNLVYLMKDAGIRAKASATAAAVLGICGLPSLVKAGEYLILLSLAYEESLVDVAALLQGYRVPMTKNAKTFHMAYEELFVCNGKLIREKAKTYEKAEAGLAAGFTYEELLCFFMAAMKEDTLCWRALDLIQENMRCRYDASYVLGEGIVYSEISVDYHLPQKALSLPVGNLLEFMGYRRRKQVHYGY